MLHDEEIDGTATIGAGCLQEFPGYYPCSASEACWNIAHDRWRCMPRCQGATGPDVTICQSMFPGQLFLDCQGYGQDNMGNSGIAICVHNNYTNGLTWHQIATQLNFTDGYYGNLFMPRKWR